MSRVLGLLAAWAAVAAALVAHGLHTARMNAIRRDGARVWATVRRP